MKLISSATLRALMDQKDVSLADMARATERSKGFISHLTRGRKSTCSPEVADRIARRLDLPLEILFVPSASANDGRSTLQRKAAA